MYIWAGSAALPGRCGCLSPGHSPPLYFNRIKLLSSGEVLLSLPWSLLPHHLYTKAHFKPICLGHESIRHSERIKLNTQRMFTLSASEESRGHFSSHSQISDPGRQPGCCDLSRDVHRGGAPPWERITDEICWHMPWSEDTAGIIPALETALRATSSGTGSGNLH